MPMRAFKRRLRKGPTDALRAAVAMNTRLELAFKEVPGRDHKGRYNGRITFFAAEESMHRGFLDRRTWWSRAATEGIEWHLLPGTHNLMCHEPLLAGFAEVLQQCLSRARSAVRSQPDQMPPA
jgi:thioesterase domain-containing protein